MIPQLDHRMADARTLVEQRLHHWLDRRGDGPDRFVASVRHALLSGGKRFRPFLVLESARLCAAPSAAALDVATALECIHCYSLVHDDLPAMDNDETRRGQPTVWKAYDEWTAILAGDALLTLAFEILTTTEETPPAVQVHLVRALAQASGMAGMVGGQAWDLTADKLQQPPHPDLPHVRRLQDMKTGALIRFACTAGAILASRPPSEHAALASYGDHLGFAFQIADDILDATGTSAVVGKAVGKDVKAGKATLLSLMSLPTARQKLQEATDAAIAALKPFGDKADTLRDAARFVAERNR